MTESRIHPLKIIMNADHLPKMEKIMSMMTGIDDLIREVSNTKDKNTPYESKEVQEIKLWWDGQVYPNIDIAYDSNEISFQFLEKLSSVVREYGYKIHDQCRPNYTDFRRKSSNDVVDELFSTYSTKIVLKFEDETQ